jgi:hypothetical protein
MKGEKEMGKFVALLIVGALVCAFFLDKLPKEMHNVGGWIMSIGLISLALFSKWFIVKISKR